MEYARNSHYHWVDVDRVMILDSVTGEMVRFGMPPNSIGTLDDALKHLAGGKGCANREVIVRLNAIAAFELKRPISQTTTYKVSELTGALLDAAVARAEGINGAKVQPYKHSEGDGNFICMIPALRGDASDPMGQSHICKAIAHRGIGALVAPSFRGN